MLDVGKPNISPNQVAHVLTQESKNLKHEIQTEWQEALGHPLTQDEFQEVLDDLSAFFRLLWTWDSALKDQN